MHTKPLPSLDAQRYAETFAVFLQRSLLKNKGQPRSGETGMFFMPPRKASRKPVESSESLVKRPCCR
jgi:hypothetical protein